MIVKTNEYLAHYGIVGQKWGIRRYQNDDGRSMGLQTVGPDLVAEQQQQQV